MTALHAYLEREDGTRLVECRDVVGAARYICTGREATTLLRFVDPYGETLFNKGQCKVLRGEWAEAMKEAPTELATWMADVAKLIEGCLNDVHLYVRFSGD